MGALAAQEPELTITEMAKAMQTIANDPELRVQMGKAGRQLVNDNFNWNVVGERLDTLYLGLAAKVYRSASARVSFY